jgi:hypothetical protein
MIYIFYDKRTKTNGESVFTLEIHLDIIVVLMVYGVYLILPTPTVLELCLCSTEYSEY